MKKSATIRRISAGLLLVLFAFGITPKLTLHNLVATHKDGKVQSSSVNPFSTQLHKATFNCKCYNQVSEPPFFAEPTSAYALSGNSFFDYQDCFAEEVDSSQPNSSGLRGPPTC